MSFAGKMKPQDPQSAEEVAKENSLPVNQRWNHHVGESQSFFFFFFKLEILLQSTKAGGNDKDKAQMWYSQMYFRWPIRDGLYSRQYNMSMQSHLLMLYCAVLGDYNTIMITISLYPGTNGPKKTPPQKKKKNIHTCTNGWCRIFSSRKLKFADRSVVLTGLFASQSQSTYRYLGCAIYFYRIKINIWTFNIKM